MLVVSVTDLPFILFWRQKKISVSFPTDSAWKKVNWEHGWWHVVFCICCVLLYNPTLFSLSQFIFHVKICWRHFKFHGTYVYIVIHIGYRFNYYLHTKSASLIRNLNCISSAFRYIFSYQHQCTIFRNIWNVIQRD